MRGAAAGLLAGLLLAGCAAGVPGAPPATLEWRGEVLLEESLTLPRGSRLVIHPGTTVRFAFRDTDNDGWGDLFLRVEGDLVALGTASDPILFTSVEQPAAPGLWGELRLDFGRFDLRYAVIEGSTRGLHTHFSEGRLENAILRRNVDGTRFGESTVEVRNCLFSGHPGKGYNARQCRNRVVGNLFCDNRNGVFLFEGDAGSQFEGNRFRGNDHDLRLGDFFVGTVATRGNDWGGDLPPGVTTAPAAAPAAGPRDWPLWEQTWLHRLGDAFVDARPAVTDEGVYGASWGGLVVRLGTLDGTVLAQAALPDAVDAGVALGPGTAAVACWDRGLYLLERSSLRLLDAFFEEPSAADDHRQSTPVFAGSTLFAGSWAGRVRAFETGSGRLRQTWSFAAAGPFRAELALAGDTLLAPSQDGTLYALDRGDGTPRWTYRSGAALLSGPAVTATTAFLADRDGVLHAVDLGTGRARWTRPLGAPVWYAAPLLSDGVLYQGDDSGTLHAVDAASGEVLWQRPLGAGVRAQPCSVAGDAVAVPTLGGRLYLLDTRSGLVRDVWELAQPSQSSPAAVADLVFLGGRDGSLRALRARAVAASAEERQQTRTERVY